MIVCFILKASKWKQNYFWHNFEFHLKVKHFKIYSKTFHVLMKNVFVVKTRIRIWIVKYIMSMWSSSSFKWLLLHKHLVIVKLKFYFLLLHNIVYHIRLWFKKQIVWVSALIAYSFLKSLSRMIGIFAAQCKAQFVCHLST